MRRFLVDAIPPAGATAIIRLGKGNRYEINYDLCTGCQACFLQCPCHAIEMVQTGGVA